MRISGGSRDVHSRRGRGMGERRAGPDQCRESWHEAYRLERIRGELDTSVDCILCVVWGVVVWEAFGMRAVLCRAT